MNFLAQDPPMPLMIIEIGLPETQSDLFTSA